MKIVTIKPVAGRLILMPELGFQPVPEAGAPVELNSFYAKAIADGDVQIVNAVQPAQSKRADTSKGN